MDGLHHNDSVYARLVDSSGNAGNVTSNQIKDNNFPSGEVELRLENSTGEIYTGEASLDLRTQHWVNKSIYITMKEVEDKESGVKSATYSIRKTDTAEISDSIIWETEGKYSIDYTIQDWAYNMIKGSKDIYIDKTSPTITSIEQNYTETTNQSVTITANAEDMLSGLKYYQFSREANLNEDSTGWKKIDDSTNTILKTASKEYTVTENGTYYFYVIDQAGNVAKQEIVITNIDKEKPTITSLSTPSAQYTKQGDLEAGEYLANIATPGDYIQYTPSRTSYTSPETLNGASDQTFSPSSYAGKWRVVYNDGVNVQIINTDNLGDLSTKGKEGFAYRGKILNDLAEAYVNPTYAIGGRSYYNTNTLQAKEVIDISKIHFYETDPKDMDLKSSLINTVKKDYSKLKNIGELAKEYEYYNNSRTFNCNSSISYFSVEHITNNGICADYLSVYNLYKNNTEQYNKTITYGTRAIITLKPELLKATGTGDEDAPYTIGSTIPNERTGNIVTYTATTSKATQIVGDTTNNTAITFTGEGAQGCQSKIEAVNADENGYATEYTISVAGGNANGAVSLNLEAGLFKDKAENQNIDTKTSAGLTIDNTAPTMNINVTNQDTVTKTKDLTVTLADGESGLADENNLRYYLSPDPENPRAEGYARGGYVNGQPVTIGTSLNGTYYLFIQTIYDKVGNATNETIENFYRLDGTYSFDGEAPTITKVETSNPTSKGFTVTIEASDNEGGSGLADVNAYNIYLKTSKATGYTAPISTSSNTYTFDNLEPTAEDASAMQAQTNAPYLHQGMNPVIWVDKNEDGTIDEATEEITKYTDLTAGTINPEWTQNNGDSIWAVYNQYGVTYDIYVTVTDKAGNISQPSQTIQQTMELDTNVDHKESRWANVKIEEDGSYFVWIPRYAYKITPTTDPTPSETNAGTIDVKFINGTGNTAFDGTTCAIATSNIDSTSQYVVHPAFCADVNMGGYNQDLAGIWVAKYESSREDSTDGTTWTETNTSSGEIGDVLTTKAGNTSDTKIRLVSKPGVTSWRYIRIGNSYTNAYNYNRGMDSHLMKNSEWGATAYLTHSQYGRNGNKMIINNSSDFITGNAGDSRSASSEPGTTNAYNTTAGMLASTTGNITGVYDMSGGAWEHVAAYDRNISEFDSERIDFITTGGESTKYATTYNNETYVEEPSSSTCIIGDATYEAYISGYRSWFYEYARCINYSSPLFLRGGRYMNGTAAGVFFAFPNYDNGEEARSFRMCIPGGEIEEDTIAPTVNSVVTTSGREDGFTVTINATDNEGGVGLAGKNAYTIYYKKQGESEYQSITTSSSVYEFTGLTSTLETSQANIPDLKEGMNPVIWIDLNKNGTIEEETEEITKYTDLSTKAINPTWTANDGDKKWYNYNQLNGTYDIYVTVKDENGNTSENSPTIQEKINVNQIDHKTSSWANAVDENGSYYVWIPRYEYKINWGNPGSIDVNFIAKSKTTPTSEYTIHPAFCADVNQGGYGEELSGIWVAKYEACEVNSKPVSKPNTSSWRSVSVERFYTYAYNYNRNIDSHLMKNSEWRSSGIFNP